jgi:hypothetical protein
MMGVGPSLANHLWQSTVFATAAWLMTRLLRKNRARVRYGIWLTASVKFLIPFSLLIGLGSSLPGPPAQRCNTTGLVLRSRYRGSTVL